MILKNAEIHLFSSSFHGPRNGLYLVLQDELSNIGIGEFLPVSGITPPLIKQATVQIIRFLKLFTDLILPENIQQLYTFIHNKMNTGAGINNKNPMREYIFSIEMSFTNLLAARKKQSPAKLWNSQTCQKILFNALLEDSPPLPKLVSILKKRKISTIKMKVGRNPEREIKYLKEFAGYTKGKFSFRLDANGKFSFQDAVSFLNELKVSQIPIEYIEDPIEEMNLMPALFRATGIFFAIDENIQHLHEIPFAYADGLKAIILKPTRLGPLANTFLWIQKVNAADLTAVITSQYESQVTLIYLANLASAFCNRNTVHGLGTFELENIHAPYPKKNYYKFLKNSFDLLPHVRKGSRLAAID